MQTAATTHHTPPFSDSAPDLASAAQAAAESLAEAVSEHPQPCGCRHCTALENLCIALSVATGRIPE